jgi:hypothetical protein
MLQLYRTIRVAIDHHVLDLALLQSKLTTARFGRTYRSRPLRCVSRPLRCVSRPLRCVRARAFPRACVCVRACNRGRTDVAWRRPAALGRRRCRRAAAGLSRRAWCAAQSSTVATQPSTLQRSTLQHSPHHIASQQHVTIQSTARCTAGWCAGTSTLAPRRGRQQRAQHVARVSAE